VLFIPLNKENAALSKHGLKQCFLPEMLYFHALAASGHKGTNKEPEMGNKILSDHFINLS
jgi:hypothetical protein